MKFAVGGTNRIVITARPKGLSYGLRIIEKVKHVDFERCY